MTSEKTVGLCVMVDEAHRGKMADVARDLKKKGFVVDQELTEIGVFTGRAPNAALKSLSSVPGVSAVEENREDYRTQ